MAAAGILYFEVVNLTIFRRVDSEKFEICTKFGLNIRYSN